MAFGIEIINNNDRILIDNNYPNIGFFSTSTSTATSGSNYPGLAGNVASDLVVARANTNTNGVVSKDINSTPPTWYAGGTSPITYYLLRRFDTLGVSQSGYGVQVYANTGNVTFTSNISKNFEIVTVGTFNSFISNTFNIAFPSSTTWYSDFTKYYCAINPTASFQFTIPSVGTNIFICGYRYVWANSTHGRIVVESNQQPPGTSPLNKLNRDFHYMILKELT